MRKNKKNNDMDEELDKLDSDFEAGEDMDFGDEMDLMEREDYSEIKERANQRRTDRHER